MVPPEQAGGDEIGHDHIDTVVLVCHQDTDHAHGTKQPANQMVPPKRPRRVLREREGETGVLAILMTSTFICGLFFHVYTVKKRKKKKKHFSAM